MKTVLVTGGDGFIGSHLTRELLEKNEVHVIVEKGKSVLRLNDVQDKIKIHYADLSNYEEIKRVVDLANPEIIFHLAAYVDPDRNHELTMQMFKNNVAGTINLLNALQNTNYEIFINTGTCEEYGDGPTPFREDQIPTPVSPYSTSKVATTFLCNTYQKIFGCPIITLRPFLTYGPGQAPNRLVPALITKCVEKEPIKTTKGEQTRDFIYVGDTVRGYIKASESKNAVGEIINVGSGKEVQIKEIITKIVDLMGNPIIPKFGALPYREGETMHFYCDNSKAKKLLNWEPQINLEEGLKKTIGWYKNEFTNR